MHPCPRRIHGLRRSRTLHRRSLHPAGSLQHSWSSVLVLRPCPRRLRPFAAGNLHRRSLRRRKISADPAITGNPALRPETVHRFRQFRRPQAAERDSAEIAPMVVHYTTTRVLSAILHSSLHHDCSDWKKFEIRDFVLLTLESWQRARKQTPLAELDRTRGAEFLAK